MSRRSVLLVLALLLLTNLPLSAHAATYSIPVNGRWSNSKITLAIPPTPRWAHDVVVNASLVWNRAQVWFQDNFVPFDNAYSFIESEPGNVSVSFTMPPKYGCVAVGWTDYQFALSSTTILAAHTYLDQSVFSAIQENNVTARQYALRLALHELGRVLGLGSVIDSRDIMNPLATPSRGDDPPMLSTLDLFAVHVLASRTSLTYSFITLNTDQYQFVDARVFLNNVNEHDAPTTNQPSSVPVTLCEIRAPRFIVCR